MARTSSTSNPTGLVEIDRNDVSIVVTEVDDARSVSLSRLEVGGYKLSPELKVVLVARAGSTSQRIELGSLGAWDRDAHSIPELDRNAALRFRVLLHEAASPKLAASCENLRARNTDRGESLLPMEAVDLGEEVWRLDMSPEGPLILFNKIVFPTASVAARHPAFAPLIMPEVVRQICRKLASNPEVLADEADVLFPWGRWLDDLGVDRPPESADGEDMGKWGEEVVSTFSRRYRFASKLRQNIVKEHGND